MDDEKNNLKVSNILDEFYNNEYKDKGVDILTEEDSKTKRQKCFKEVLKEKGKSIPKMTEAEKKEFFDEVKKKC